MEKVFLFAEKLSQLRKERNISQKKAATDLGISQALLSHYEKGIRECGLDFVVRCSKYYNVTADYLLGLSENRNGVDIDSVARGNDENDTNFISSAMKTILDVSASATEAVPAKYVENYLTLCVYRGALALSKAGGIPKNLFKFDCSLGRELANAAIALQDAKFIFIEDKSRVGEELANSPALAQLINEAEENILSNLVVDELF